MSEHLSDVRFYVDSFYAIQHHRIKANNRIDALVRSGLDPESVKQRHEWLGDALGEIEDRLAKAISQEIGEQPIWTEWLSKVKGIGPLLGGCLIARIGSDHYPSGKWKCPMCGERFYHQKLAEEHEGHGPAEEQQPVRGIAAFDNISRLWAFCGLHVKEGKAARRKRGEKANWNDDLKLTCWKAGESMIKTNSPYREVYDRAKEGYALRPGLTKLHVHNMAKRKMVKMLLSHLWVEWRVLEGLTVTKAYVHEKLGHTTEIGSREYLW